MQDTRKGSSYSSAVVQSMYCTDPESTLGFVRMLLLKSVYIMEHISVGSLFEKTENMLFPANSCSSHTGALFDSDESELTFI